MSKESLELEFEAIENEIKKICVEKHGIHTKIYSLYDIFMGHGISGGEQNNFWLVIEGNIELYDNDIEELLKEWSKCYKGKGDLLDKYDYVGKIQELTRKIYSGDEKAEHIVKKLEELAIKKEKKYEKKIVKLLEEIMEQCRKLIIVANSLQKLIDELKTHARELEEKLQSEIDLQALKDSEYRYAKHIRKRMIRIGNMGWRIVQHIYVENEKTLHIFNKLRKLMI